jgi:hypothetical protein
MRPPNYIKIGIRLQASVVIAAVALWFVSIAGIAGSSYRRPGLRFWEVVFGISACTALVFIFSLWLSYLRSTRAYGGWVSAATLAILVPIFLYVFLYLANS